MTISNTRAEIARFVERVERIDGDIDGLKSDRRDLMKEIGNKGFNPKAIAAVVKRRRETDDQAKKRRSLEDDIDVYLHALGETPLEEAIRESGA